MAKKKKAFEPKLASFCVGCGADRKQMNAPPGFCKACEPLAQAAAASGRLITYCRKCAAYGRPSPHVHGRSLVATASERAKEKIVVIVYEAEIGCPACHASDNDLAPHPMIVSMPNTGWSAA